jgi:iron complex outermembrane receptor protein
MPRRTPVLAGLLAAILVADGAQAQPPSDAAHPQPQAAAPRRDLTALSILELANTKVTSVAKKAETRLATAAAVHVLTGTEIQDSGGTSLVDAVRAAPGVHVARINGTQWALGIRGFTSRLARSQLALIDGRSVYTPLFAGTYWDVQDTLLEDVDRIEIVRGPGGTLWGANAVNGIISVITKRAQDTPGGFVTAGGGNEERAFVRARHGGRLGERGAYRVYGKLWSRGAGFHESGPDFDDSHLYQGGFRADWDLREADELTVQGDLYSGRQGERVTVTRFEKPFTETVFADGKVSGGNVVVDWRRTFSNQSQLALQVYYDHSVRDQVSLREARDTGDVDLQYRFPIGKRHDLVMGAGYRVSDGRTRGLPSIAFRPPNRTTNLVSGFLQDEIAVVPGRFTLTLGTKVEHNDFSELELQPSGRLLWTPNDRHSLWAAVTRAVRTPSAIEHDLDLFASLSPDLPIFAVAAGNPDFQTERMLAFDGGYRVRVSERLFVDVALFHNHFPNLLSVETEAPFVQDGRQIVPFAFENKLKADVSGVEVSADIKLSGRWLATGTYAYLDMNVRPLPGSTDRTSANSEGAAPRHRAQLRSTITLSEDVSLFGLVRWSGALPTQEIEAFAEASARLSWRPTSSLELAVVGNDLLHDHHGEFGGTSPAYTEIERSVYGQATWRW